MELNLLEEIQDSPPTDELRIWGLSGAGFVMRIGDEILFVDPWLVPPDPSRTTHRKYPPPFPPEAVKRAVAVVSTHEHEDHCNPETVIGISRSSGAVLVGPVSSIKKAVDHGYPESKAVTVSPGERYAASQNFSLRAFKANDPYEPSALMYLVETPRGNVFDSGDSSYFGGFKEIGDKYLVDVALLNFGKQIPTPDKPYYLSAEKVAFAARDLRAKVVVPMHWNLWTETLEDPGPIGPLLKSMSPGSKLVILDGGEKLEI